MSGFSFYAVVVGFCLGILSQQFLGFGLVEAVWVLVVSLGVGLVWSKNRKAIFAPQTLAVSVCLLALALGVLRTEVATWNDQNTFLESQLGSEISLEGVIVREPDLRERTQHLYIKSEKETVLVIVDRYRAYSYGDKVSFVGKVEKPQAFETDLGRTFNYPGFLKSKGVNYMMRYAEVEVVDSGHRNIVLNPILSFKQSFMGTIESLIKEPEVALGEGLLLGVKQAIGEDLEKVFRKTGIIHIVVLSGYNVSLVVIFVMYVLSYLLPFRARLVVGLLAISCFALLVGLSATVLRASLMASFILLAKYSGWTYAVMRGLMLAGLVMLVINPYLLPFDVGFQLSFLATMGLILLAPYIERWVTFMPETIGLREFLVATISTQIFVMPLLLWQIGEFSLVSVVVNVLVLPMVPVAMFLTFVSGMVGFISIALALPLAYLAQLSLAYILVVAEWFSRLPFASYTVPSFPFWLVFISYGLMAYVLWRLVMGDEVEEQKEIFVRGESDFSHWTIEEESELVKRIKEKKAGVDPLGSTPANQDSTPVFFK